MIEWVLKSALWLTLFWCVWKLLLSRETFYKFNRQYLAAALILSLILPAVQLHYVREIKSVPVELQFTEVETTTSPAITTAPVVDESASRLDWMVLVLACYATGVLIMATGVVRRGIRIRGIIRKHGYTQYDGYRIVEVAGSTPFSVGRYIFLDSAMSEAEREIIISHELAHIRGRHRLDLLLAGAVCAIQWFNPFARLTMRAVRDNHEYIADTAVLANGCSRAIYKATLINSALGDRVFTLGHTFAGSGKNNLKRYTMMNRKNSHNARKLAVFALLLPIAAIILAAFAKPRYVISQNTETIRPDTTGVTKLSYSGQPDNIDILQRLGYDKTNSAGYLLILDDHEVSVDKINALDLQKITAATVLRHEAAEPYRFCRFVRISGSIPFDLTTPDMVPSTPSDRHRQ